MKIENTMSTPPTESPRPEEPPIDIDYLEEQIAWELEEQLVDGSIKPSEFVAKNRQRLRELLEKAVKNSSRDALRARVAELEAERDAAVLKLAQITTELAVNQVSLATCKTELRGTWEVENQRDRVTAELEESEKENEREINRHKSTLTALATLQTEHDALRRDREQLILDTLELDRTGNALRKKLPPEHHASEEYHNFADAHDKITSAIAKPDNHQQSGREEGV